MPLPTIPHFHYMHKVDNHDDCHGFLGGMIALLNLHHGKSAVLVLTLS